MNDPTFPDPEITYAEALRRELLTSPAFIHDKSNLDN